MRHEVTDEGDARQYWTQLPNIIFEIGLKPLELVLYAHLKRAAGASANGKCFKSTATLARETGMGAGTVSRTKTSLEAKRATLGNRPLIRTREVINPRGGKPFQEITITDIWKANTDRFTSSTVEVVPSSVEVEGQNQVPVEVGSSSKPISTVEIKNNVEEELREGEQKQPSPHSRLMEFHNQHLDGPIPDPAAQGAAIKWLVATYKPDTCEACYRSLLRDGWRARVSWLTVKSEIGAWLPRNGNGHQPARSAEPARPLPSNVGRYECECGFTVIQTDRGIRDCPEPECGKKLRLSLSEPDAKLSTPANVRMI